MNIFDLELYELIQCNLVLIFISISILLGIKLILKYFTLKVKEKTFYLVGFALILMSSPWWGLGISFLSILFFQRSLSLHLYAILNNAFIPLAVILWLNVFLNLVYRNYKIEILLIYIILAIIYEIFFWVLLFFDIKFIIYQIDIFHTHRTLFTFTFPFLGIITLFITGLKFAKITLMSSDPIIKWKGIFFGLAILLFFYNAILESINIRIPLILILGKTQLIISAIFFYFGFFISNRIVAKLNR